MNNNNNNNINNNNIKRSLKFFRRAMMPYETFSPFFLEII